ncbi:MAG TPA: type II toxin-antitoxin system VapC family toxin [Rhizomicrobium sp.]|nr:type II toxin-antitoxin system VapC family toxin [Rhizomicrobium sp.]
MIGLDTNILIRYITQDDAIQSPKATRILERELSLQNPGFVSTVTIAETVWVLDAHYGFTGEAIAQAVETMLQVEELVFEHEPQVVAAVGHFRQGADFSDALIAGIALRVGCSSTLTFDRKASRLPGIRLVS